jgi:thiamine pyrophosphate-dependent acetolactate synthase large subunit-like protein
MIILGYLIQKLSLVNHIEPINFTDMDLAKFAESCGGVGYTLKDPNRIDEVVEEFC